MDFSWSEMLEGVASTDEGHPPLYYLLLRSWVWFCGVSEIGLRSLSVFFGMAALFFMAGVGYELPALSIDPRSRTPAASCWRTSFVTTLLVAFSLLQIHASRQARMYSLGAAFFAFGTWMLLHSTRRPFVRANGCCSDSPHLASATRMLSALSLSSHRWFSPQCFSAPAGGQFGRQVVRRRRRIEITFTMTSNGRLALGSECSCAISLSCRFKPRRERKCRGKSPRASPRWESKLPRPSYRRLLRRRISPEQALGTDHLGDRHQLFISGSAFVTAGRGVSWPSPA